MESEHLHLPSTAREVEILELIRALNKDPKVHGIIVQVSKAFF